MRWRLHERDPQPHCIRGQPRLACAVVGHLSWRTGELLGTAIGWSTGLCDMARTVRDGACREGSSSQRASAARLETRRVTAEVRGARRESSPSQRASAAQLETRGVTAEGSSRPGHRVCGKSSTSCYGDQRILFSSLALPRPPPRQPGLPRLLRDMAPCTTRVVYAPVPDFVADTAASYHDSARVNGSGVVLPRHRSTPNQRRHVRAALSAGGHSGSTGAVLPTQPAEHCRARQPRPAWQGAASAFWQHGPQPLPHPRRDLRPSAPPEESTDG